MIVSTLKRGLKNSARSAAASGRVAYGRPANSSQFPSVVYLNVGDSMCTGTIIARKAVLTAAHCVRTDKGEWLDAEKIKVYYGSEVWSDSSINTVDLIISGSYDPDTSYGDIALLRLVDPIDIAFVPLASANTKLTRKVSVVGWGTMENQDDPKVLMYSEVSTMTTKRCKIVHKNIFGDYPPRGTMCYGLDTTPPTASCAGDSGGPYFTTGTNKFQTGIVSYGPDIECGAKKHNLDMGSSIAYWRNWIYLNMADHDMK